MCQAVWCSQQQQPRRLPPLAPLSPQQQSQQANSAAQASATSHGSQPQLDNSTAAGAISPAGMSVFHNQLWSGEAHARQQPAGPSSTTASTAVDKCQLVPHASDAVLFSGTQSAAQHSPGDFIYIQAVKATRHKCQVASSAITVFDKP